MSNLHPNVQNQLAAIRRDLKTQSKNNVVRAVLGLMVELSKKDLEYKNKLAKLEMEAKVAEGFIAANEALFAAYLDAQPKESAEVGDGPTQALDNEKVG